MIKICKNKKSVRVGFLKFLYNLNFQWDNKVHKIFKKHGRHATTGGAHDYDGF